MPEPDPALLKGKLLFVSANVPAWRYLGYHYSPARVVAQLERKRGPTTIESYELVLLEAQTGDVFDRSPLSEQKPPSTGR